MKYKKIDTLWPHKQYPLKDITEKIIACCIEVHSLLGPGLLENIYEKALIREFEIRAMQYETQKGIRLYYKGRDVGNYRIDFLIEDSVVLELKSTESLHEVYIAQILTYLKAINKRVGLLINFNVTKLATGIKRLIL